MKTYQKRRARMTQWIIRIYCVPPSRSGPDFSWERSPIRKPGSPSPRAALFATPFNRLCLHTASLRLKNSSANIMNFRQCESERSPSRAWIYFEGIRASVNQSRFQNKSCLAAPSHSRAEYQAAGYFAPNISRRFLDGYSTGIRVFPFSRVYSQMASLLLISR